MDREYAGFWGRLLAFSVDYLLLAAPVYVLAALLPIPLDQLGVMGRVLGLGVMLLYFGLGNSSVFGGQTVGKRLFGLRVTDRDGQNLSVGRSVLRASVLCVPETFNGAPLPVWLMDSLVLGPLLGVLVFAGWLGPVIFYLFNTPSRRCVHDYASRSAVMKTAIAPTFGPNLPKKLFGVLGGLVVLMLTVPLFFSGYVASMRPALQEIIGSPKVWNVIISGRPRTEEQKDVQEPIGIGITAHVYGDAQNREETARELALLAIKNLPHAHDHDLITVGLVYGYDLGFVSSREYKNIRHTVSEWRTGTAGAE